VKEDGSTSYLPDSKMCEMLMVNKEMLLHIVVQHCVNMNSECIGVIAIVKRVCHGGGGRGRKDALVNYAILILK